MKSVINNTSKLKRIWVDDADGITVEYCLLAGECREFEDTVANTFMETFPSMVVPKIDRELEYKQNESAVWLANCTGNPFVSKTVAQQFVNRQTKEIKEFVVPNPLASPTTLKFVIQGDERMTSVDVLTTIVTVDLPTTVVIPAFSIIPVPQSIAEVIVNRAARADPLNAGFVKAIERPPEWLPNASWSLDDLIVYGELIDPELFNVENLRTTFKKEIYYNKDKTRIEAARAFVWAHVFHRIIDPEYALPAKASFVDRKSNQKVAKLG